MSAAETSIRSARRHLDVFEESWKADHEEAMLPRFRGVPRGRRDGLPLDRSRLPAAGAYVFQGVEEPSGVLDDMEKQAYARWLQLADSQAEILASLEKDFGVVEGAEEFQECRTHAKATLGNWAAAVPSLAIGSRVVDFSEGDADQIHGLLDQDEHGAGRPTPPPPYPSRRPNHAPVRVFIPPAQRTPPIRPRVVSQFDFAIDKPPLM